jgi:hypothetical protein
LSAGRGGFHHDLSQKEHRLDEAMWNMMHKVRTSILSGDDDNKWGIHT